MKVKISETVEVSDDQRSAIAAKLEKKVATRDDIRNFVWGHGSEWATWLEPHPSVTGSDDEDDDLLGDSDDEDLLGDSDDEDLLGDDDGNVL